MKLRLIPWEFAVCQPGSPSDIAFGDDFCFLSKTDEELSLVCRVESIPANCLQAESGWRMLGVEGPLDFALTGILAQLAGVLANADIPIFAVSTYNTDYILVRSEDLSGAIDALKAEGHTIHGGT